MLENSKGFSGFSVNDLVAAKHFYGQILGIPVKEMPEGLMLTIAGGNGTFVYQKDDHQPATYTILNFPVDDIDAAVDTLVNKGIVFEYYADMTDEKGIARGIAEHNGPDIAWFKDPFGNIISVLHST